MENKTVKKESLESDVIQDTVDQITENDTQNDSKESDNENVLKDVVTDTESNTAERSKESELNEREAVLKEKESELIYYTFENDIKSLCQEKKLVKNNRLIKSFERCLDFSSLESYQKSFASAMEFIDSLMSSSMSNRSFGYKGPIKGGEPVHESIIDKAFKPPKVY